MGRSGGIGQLFKGIVIGVVLILAIIGSMSILDKNNGIPFFTPSTSTQVKDTAPSNNTITPKLDNTNETVPNITVEESQQETPPSASINQATRNNDTLNVPEQQPEQSNNQQENKSTKKSKKSGLLQLEVINKKTKDKLNASFVIFDRSDEKVTEIHSTESATFRLPVGQYKVVTTLTKVNDIERETKPVQQIRIVNIRANSTSTQIFQLKPASTLGVLQVSANNFFNGSEIKANFTVQKENGEIVATRSNVPSSLFKLKAGSYKVIVTSGTYSDYRTVVIEPSKSSKEVFKLQDASAQGSVFIRILDTLSENSVKADIVISSMDNETLQSLKAVSQSELSLPSGRYKISASTKNSQSSKTITVIAEQQQQTLFRFDAPQNSETDASINPETNTSVVIETDTESSGVRITQNVRITGIEDSENTDTEEEITNSENDENTTVSISPEIQAKPESQQTPNTAILRVFAQWGANNTPLKSNFYVQMPNGKNVAKKIYADSAVFKLNPGSYKVTVRSNGRPNIVKNIQITKGQDVSLNFASRSNVVTINKTNSSARSRTEQVTRPTQTSTVPSGFLNVKMNPPKRTQFIISTRAGREVAEVNGVPSGKFKLDEGQYTITAIFNNIRRSKTINLKARRTTTLNFKAQDFMRKNNNTTPQASTIVGILRSRILDENGKPLKGNLTVTNTKEKVIARANNVSVGFFRLPPARYKISINYKDLIGSEMITVKQGETIEQAFTIASPR